MYALVELCCGVFYNIVEEINQSSLVSASRAMTMVLIPELTTVSFFFYFVTVAFVTLLSLGPSALAVPTHVCVSRFFCRTRQCAAAEVVDVDAAPVAPQVQARRLLNLFQFPAARYRSKRDDDLMWIGNIPPPKKTNQQSSTVALHNGVSSNQSNIPTSSHLLQWSRHLSPPPPKTKATQRSPQTSSIVGGV